MAAGLYDAMVETLDGYICGCCLSDPEDYSEEEQK